MKIKITEDILIGRIAQYYYDHVKKLENETLVLIASTINDILNKSKEEKLVTFIDYPDPVLDFFRNNNDFETYFTEISKTEIKLYKVQFNDQIIGGAIFYKPKGINYFIFSSDYSQAKEKTELLKMSPASVPGVTI